MGLEIQGAVNSMIGSANRIVQQHEENMRKAANIAIGVATGAATGGVGGAIAGGAKAVAQQAGIHTPSGGSSNIQGADGGAGGSSLQDTASRIALQNAQQEVAFKKAQKDRFNEMRRELHGER